MAQIGIDLGTTNSVAAMLIRGRPEIILSRENERYFPSVVAPRKGGLLVGAPAGTRPEAFSSVKRLMGRRVSDPEVAKAKEKGNIGYEVIPDPSDGEQVQVKLGDTVLTPVTVAAEILRKIKKDAEDRFGPITDAVITVPAYFYDNQRVATRQAGALAGLKVMQVLHEPTAAALAFGLEQGQDGDDVRRVLVYDLGGGTFDVSLMTLADGIPMVDTTEGDPYCGGDDFDLAIVEHVLQQLERQYPGKVAAMRGHVRFMHGLKKHAERAKIELSQADNASVDWLDAPRIDGEEIEIEVTIRRTDFEQWIRPHIDKTLALMHKALANVELTPDQIDDVLLVGGSTSIPLVRQLLAAEFGRDKLRMNINPMECVAVGAAMRASEQKKIICPVCNHANEEDAETCQGEDCGQKLAGVKESLICPKCGHVNPEDAAVCGNCEHTFASSAEGRTAMPYGIALKGGDFDILIPKDTLFPTEKPHEKEFQTHSDAQPAFLIEVCEGQSMEAAKNQLVGSIVVPIPEGSRGPAGLRANIGLSVDKDSILSVVVKGLGPLAEVQIEARLERNKRLQLCSKCGEVNEDAETKCRSCGEPLKQAGEAGEKSCPKCDAPNSSDAQVCSRCGARLDSGAPEWAKELEFMALVMLVARTRCTWFLSAQQLQLAEQLENEAEKALAQRDEAAGRRTCNRIKSELFEDGGAFRGVEDLIWAELHSTRHKSAEQRAEVGDLLSRFRSAWDKDRAQALDIRREMVAAINAGPTGDGPGTGPIDFRPGKV